MPLPTCLSMQAPLQRARARPSARPAPPAASRRMRGKPAAPAGEGEGSRGAPGPARRQLSAPCLPPSPNPNPAAPSAPPPPSLQPRGHLLRPPWRPGVQCMRARLLCQHHRHRQLHGLRRRQVHACHQRRGGRHGVRAVPARHLQARQCHRQQVPEVGAGLGEGLRLALLCMRCACCGLKAVDPIPNRSPFPLTLRSPPAPAFPHSLQLPLWLCHPEGRGRRLVHRLPQGPVRARPQLRQLHRLRAWQIHRPGGPEELQAVRGRLRQHAGGRAAGARPGGLAGRRQSHRLHDVHGVPAAHLPPLHLRDQHVHAVPQRA